MDAKISYGYANAMRGRPPKPKGERRSNVLRILLTAAERRALDKAAKGRALETSTWARMVLLAAAPGGAEKSARPAVNRVGGG